MAAPIPTTCAPCLTEIPLLNELVDKYADQNVVFLAPTPEPIAKVAKTLAERKFTYTVVPDFRSLSKALRVVGYPCHFVIDKKGIIRGVYLGSLKNVQTDESVADMRLTKAIEKELEK